MNTGTRRATVILGLIMVIAMGSSVILPLFRANTQNRTTAPTATPGPTLPPPITDLSSINFDQTYVHPSGLFSVSDPAGWTPSTPVNNGGDVEIAFSNSTQASIVQVMVRVPDPAPAAPLTLDDVDAYWSNEALSQSWARYTNWRETSPERVRENDKLSMDFEVTLRTQTYVARQVSWTDGDWIYNVRVVALENATDMIKYMVDALATTLKPNKEFVGTPTDWNAYIDQTTGLAMRFPALWTVTDSAPERPTTIDGSNLVLRLETLADTTVADDAAARAWVEGTRPNVSVTSVNPVERGGDSGFSVAYSYTTTDGEAQSGLALLLNSADSKVYVANLRLFAPNVDLNSEDAAATYGDVLEALKTFTVLPVQ
ncbi:MAG: hypothetical protein K8I60_00915 [Anaerolineae bacterium]|nr:hypothetical protein [Anaerolineae bacterium]